MTTSSRYQRAETRQRRDSNPAANAGAQQLEQQQLLPSGQPIPRLKRRLERVDHDFTSPEFKKARISVEIPARSPSRQLKSAIPHPDVKARPGPKQAAKPSPQTAPFVANTILTPAPGHTDSNTAPPPAEQKVSKEYQRKVANGLKHELNRLKADVPDTKEGGGRKLRSQEGTRFKSELSAYFPDYDEVIGNDPKEEHILNFDTPIIITDVDHSTQGPPQPTNSHYQWDQHQPQHQAQVQSPAQIGRLGTVRGYGDNLFTELWESQVIDFSFLDTGKAPSDPLPDDVFQPAHKKAERLERSIRNAEKGRAQHERDQVVRLLEGLQGHDWLRVMGVSGITETKKKQFEPARVHFIQGCQAILAKFRAWAEEEKRLKLEREHAAAAEAEAEAEEETEDDQEEDEEDEGEEESTDGEEVPVEEIADSEADDPDPNTQQDGEGYASSDGDPPDLSDVDASIAKQLRDEAIAAANLKFKRSKAATKRSKDEAAQSSSSFTSFYRKPYQRDAAMSHSRRRGRVVMAFGYPIPDMPDQEFELPADFLTDDTLKARERRKRRERRAKKD